MKNFLTIFWAFWLFFVPTAQRGQQSTVPAPPPIMPMTTMSGLLRLVQTIPLPTEGYMDHFAVDVKGQRLFIAGEANKSIVTVDLRAGKVIQETKGLGGNPRKPFYVPETNEIWTDLGDNTVVAISGTTYEVTKTVELTGGRGAARRTPDNGAYDPETLTVLLRSSTPKLANWSAV